MRNITKAVFLNAMACPKLGWLLRNEGESDRGFLSDVSAGEEFLLEQGARVHRRARSVYPRGRVIEDRGMRKAVAATRAAIGDRAVKTIYEGAFMSGGFTARADVLRRARSGWHLLEIKSSCNDRPEFTDDMAYTAMVLRQAGLDICEVSIVLISKDYRLGMKDERLFTQTDHTHDVLDLAAEFLVESPEIKRRLSLSRSPRRRLAFECKRCDIWPECVGKGINHHIFRLPRLSRSKFEQLCELGISSIEEIPAAFPLTQHQAAVREAIQKKGPVFGDGLRKHLRRIARPAYYLDFETVMTAIPLYRAIAPFTQIPTQYSIHRCTAPGEIAGHCEYLADPSRDCRRDLAEHLIADLPGKGSVIVYSNFEKVVINALADLYPDLAGHLASIVERLVDLEIIIRKNFYHPDFGGRTSIKVTLPALVPGMRYDDLDISEGGSAMAAFADLALGRYDEGEALDVKRHLLEYCKQDTLAMVRLHEHLAAFA
jgi:hypothetical protein